MGQSLVIARAIIAAFKERCVALRDAPVQCRSLSRFIDVVKIVVRGQLRAEGISCLGRRGSGVQIAPPRPMD
jgi:hypothetical protein